MGQLDKQFTKLMSPIRDPEIEVYFSDRKASFGVWLKMTWLELQQRLSPKA